MPNDEVLPLHFSKFLVPCSLFRYKIKIRVTKKLTPTLFCRRGSMIRIKKVPV